MNNIIPLNRKEILKISGGHETHEDRIARRLEVFGDFFPGGHFCDPNSPDNICQIIDEENAHFDNCMEDTGEYFTRYSLANSLGRMIDCEEALRSKKYLYK